ncbi:hypothetical protein HRTV-28_gp21 [Halorubrum tailed virus 28]|uniref:Uncharacterized protein n=1 Tax=Halorubrum tailed virus 28 TaxID=2878009 RepID=A0AAE8Y0A6_9CAUD|nr:hypothetical protein M1M39_gp22 [Halorubrum tailed virus 28]UBF23459.1 hypothetical protein HRTV-28_gp21 [Halorubrum tailed virus 28]
MTDDTQRPPAWVVDRATEASETFGVAFHEALEYELWLARETFGTPLPERDPEREQRREQAVSHTRVLAPGRFVGGGA